MDFSAVAGLNNLNATRAFFDFISTETQRKFKGASNAFRFDSLDCTNLMSVKSLILQTADFLHHHCRCTRLGEQLQGHNQQVHDSGLVQQKKIIASSIKLTSIRIHAEKTSHQRELSRATSMTSVKECEFQSSLLVTCPCHVHLNCARNTKMMTRTLRIYLH